MRGGSLPLGDGDDQAGRRETFACLCVSGIQDGAPHVLRGVEYRMILLGQVHTLMPCLFVLLDCCCIPGV